MRRTSSCLDDQTSQRGSGGRLQERSSAFLDVVTNPLNETIVRRRYLYRLDSWMGLSAFENVETRTWDAFFTAR